MLPKHKYLLTYRYAEIIFDLTTEFCLSYLSNLSHLRGIPTRRTIEQMTQAARSGKQNIVEAIGQSVTSKKGEIKLLGVAKASLEELIADYEDFLRVNNLKIWLKTDERIDKFRKTAFRLTSLSNLSDLGNLKEKALLPKNGEEAANFLLTLGHQASYLLFKQIQKAEETFIKEGGYGENLLKKRLEAKIKKSSL